MKKLALILLLIAVGTAATGLLDMALGVSLVNYPWWKNVAHKLSYMLYGALLFFAWTK